MELEQLKQRIHRIEQCADDAERALQASSAPSDLRQSIDQMHAQAEQVQQACDSPGQQLGDAEWRQRIAQLEQTGDRAMQACRSAGNQVDAQLQQAVQRAHDEISSLKKQMG